MASELAQKSQIGSDIVRPSELKERTLQIRQLMAEVMEKDVHYGTIPGCGDKPALLKAGAEQACAMFRLAPKYEVEKENLPGGHREVTVTCSLHGPDGSFWGQGLGSATTMESKHRYRGFEAVPTGKGVPKTYWDARNAGDIKRAQEILGGNGFIAKKIEGAWQICQSSGERQENENPADQGNTVLKMAKKRALVDAVLTATGMSAMFSQDMGDLEEMIEQTPSYVEPIDRDESTPPPPAKKPQPSKKSEALAERRAACLKYINENNISVPTVRAMIGGRKIEDADDSDLATIREVCQQLKNEEFDNRDMESGVLGTIANVCEMLGKLPDASAKALIKGLGIEGGIDGVKKLTSAKNLLILRDAVVNAIANSADGEPPIGGSDDGENPWD